MARNESDREDLLREATALVRRVELEVGGESEPIVIGFRNPRGISGPGAISFFWGAEYVLQFNERDELRRAFDNGRLLKAEQGRLVALLRQRREQVVELVRRPLDDVSTRAWLGEAERRLVDLASALDNGDYRMRGQVPAEADVLPSIQDWLAARGPLRVARRPNVN